MVNFWTLIIVLWLCGKCFVHGRHRLKSLEVKCYNVCNEFSKDAAIDMQV